jgi:hypothetical protein
MKEIPMRFNEVKTSEAENDEYTKWDFDDTRRPRLTLKHLNKMRKSKEFKVKEHQDEISKLKNMYGRAES